MSQELIRNFVRTLIVLVTALTVAACNDNDEPSPFGFASFYEVRSTPTTPQQIANYVAALDLDLLPRIDDPTLPTLTVGSFDSPQLIVYRLSGAVEFRHNPKLFQPGYELDAAARSMSRNEAAAVAIEFLDRLGLSLPSSEVPFEATIQEVESELRPTPNHWLVSYQFDSPQLSQTPRLLGATVDVRIGNNDELVGLYHYLPELIHGDDVELLEPTEALTRAGFGDLNLPDSQLTDPEVVYFADGENVDQIAAAPFYLFEGDEGSVIAPASNRTPWLAFDEGGSVVVHGGEPPYTATILDSAAPLFAAQMWEGSESSELFLEPLSDVPGPHTMTVLLRDSAGLLAEGKTVLTSVGGSQAVINVDAPVVGETVAATSSGWSLAARLSPGEGLVLTDVRFRGRSVVRSVSLPYLEIRLPGGTVRCELLRAVKDSAGSCDATRVPTDGIQLIQTSVGLDVSARFVVTAERGDERAELELEQLFRFEPMQRGCAPLWDPGQCAQFYPRVTYLSGLAGPSVGVRTHQRFDLSTLGSRASTFRDPDGLSVLRPRKLPALLEEHTTTGAVRGQPGDVDNYHERHPPKQISIPGCSGFGDGRLQCVHIHWRWSAYFSGTWGGGRPLVGDSQTVTLSIVAYHPGEERPWAVEDLVDGETLWPDQKSILWISTESTDPVDAFGGNHWFFR